MRFRVGTPNSVVTARNRDRSRFVPWGVRGGRPGAPSSFVLNPGTPGERNLENCDLLPVDPGDIVRVTGPGGGGYGVPWERPAGEVARDVRLGHVSAEQARRLYGVACGAAGIDEGETTRLRASLATDAPPRNFTFGSCREAWEARITPAHYEILTRLLAAAPLAWRHFLKQRILRALRDAPRDEPPGRVAELYEALRRDYQVLPPLPSLDVSTPP